MSKILLTGSAGFIGSNLAAALLKAGHQVYGQDTLTGQDLLTEKAIPGIEVVYHLAAQKSVQYSIEHPYEDAMANILTTIHLLQLYPHARFIYPGTAASFPYRSPYGLSKKVAADYIKLLTKNYVICHLPNIFGEGSKAVVENFIKSKTITINGAGVQKRTFVHVDDIVDALIKAMHWRSMEYFLGNDEMVDILTLAKATGKLTRHNTSLPNEILNSYMVNTTPNWKPKINVIDYVKLQVQANNPTGGSR